MDTDVFRNMETFKKLQDQIRIITGHTEIKKITKGYSFENKYLLTGRNQKKYLVRIAETSSDEEIRNKKTEFDTVNQIHNYSPLVPEAYSFGISDDRKLCYMILEYICGTDGEEAMKGLSNDACYRLGVDAGKELLKLHKLSAPPDCTEWHERICKKYNHKLSAFENSGIELKGINRDKLSQYISDNLPILKGSRQTFLHDDYHPSNLIIRDGKLSGIIDFNRYDWGEPVHDFLKLALFSSAASVPFSAGQIDGYNGGTADRGFWKKYSLYCAMAIIPDILWAHWYSSKKGSSDQIELSQKRIQKLYSDHDGFNSEIPRWYRDYKENNRYQ